VEEGLVASLARPGGNLTGLELSTSEVAGKRLELLKVAVPTITRVAVLSEPTEPALAGAPSPIEREARALGVELQRVEAGAPTAFEAAFATMVHGGADALLIMESALFAAHRQPLLALALRHRLPTMAYERHYAEAGSLLAYGANPASCASAPPSLCTKSCKAPSPPTCPLSGPHSSWSST
jgi:putative ABC transport system substrate-binding protein